MMADTPKPSAAEPKRQEYSWWTRIPMPEGDGWHHGVDGRRHTIALCRTEADAKRLALALNAAANASASKPDSAEAKMTAARAGLRNEAIIAFADAALARCEEQDRRVEAIISAVEHVFVGGTTGRRWERERDFRAKIAEAMKCE